MPETASNPNPDPRRRPTLVSAGLLSRLLALVVIYTSHKAFVSPLALLVVAAIGFAALLLQLRLRPDISAIRGPLWLNGTGVVFGLAAVIADFLHLNSALMLIAALAAVVFFALSGIIVLSALRKRRV